MLDLAADGLPDDRATCAQCRHCEPRRYFCTKYRMSVIPAQPLRCMGFDPAPHVADRRTGLERWPTLRQDIEDVRKIEAEARK